MSGINFKGVEEAKERTMTPPGTIDVFTISEVAFDTTKNKGTYYMGCTFQRHEDEFRHSFFLTEKALPRIQSLVKSASGETLDSEVLEEKLIHLLKGKKLGMKVTARIDEENGKAYADLSFGGFCKPVDRVSELSFTTKEEELNKKAKMIAESGASSKPDAPYKDEESFSAPATTASDEEIF